MLTGNTNAIYQKLNVSSSSTKTCFYSWDSDSPYIQVLGTELWRSPWLFSLLHSSFLVNHHYSCQVPWNLWISPWSTITPKQRPPLPPAKTMISLQPVSCTQCLPLYSAFHTEASSGPCSAHFREFLLPSGKSTGSLTWSRVCPWPWGFCLLFSLICASLSYTHVFHVPEEAMPFFSFIPLCYMPFPFLEFLCVTSFFPSIIPMNSLFGCHLPKKASPNYSHHRQNWGHPCCLTSPWNSSLTQNLFSSFPILEYFLPVWLWDPWEQGTCLPSLSLYSSCLVQCLGHSVCCVYNSMV